MTGFRDGSLVLLMACCCTGIIGCRNGDEVGLDSAPVAKPTESKEKLLLLTPSDVDSHLLHNILQVSESIFSGGEPQGEAAFAELHRMGIRTVVSVDGIQPEVELAHNFGLQYVHIPIGYDGVSEEARLAFVKLAQSDSGPLYIHCHHGTHRGPAAAAVVCRAAGFANEMEAVAILERAGTSRDYAGLWRDVREFQLPNPGTPLPELVELAEVSSLAAIMAQMDRAGDLLKLCEPAGWQPPEDHQDLVAAREALLIKEGFRESVRQLEADTLSDPALVEMMNRASQVSEKLTTALDSHDYEIASRLFKQLLQDCKDCHRTFRNGPGDR